MRFKDTDALALEKFLDFVYTGEVSLISLKLNRSSRRQFLDLAQAELSDVVFQLLKVRSSSSPLLTSHPDCGQFSDRGHPLAPTRGGPHVGPGTVDWGA